MSRESVSTLIDRWVEDAEFRAALRSDPDGTIAATGLELDAEERAAIAEMDWSSTDAELADRISKSKGGC
jgi:hypothetical protein